MKKLKILIVTDYFPWILGTWAKQISKIGSIHEYYFSSIRMQYYYPEVWDKLFTKVDLVHFLAQYDILSKLNEVLYPKSTALHPLPTITTIHHVEEGEWETLMKPLTKGDAIVVVSTEWEEFLKTKGISSNRIYIINNGVNTTKFFPFDNKLKARKKLGINSNNKLIGFSAKNTSNYKGRKRVDIFLEALRKVAKEDRTLGVVITGPGWNNFVKEIENYGIKVFYRPYLPSRLMSTYYNSLDLYLVTSDVEGGPAPLLESMACGTPVITTPVGIARDYLKDKVNCLIIPKNNVQACVDAVLRLVTSPELSSKLAMNALKTVEKYLTWEVTLAGIEQLYVDIWQEKSNKSKLGCSREIMDSAKQRNWAINFDSYLWHMDLYYQGYRREGLRGMIASIARIEPKSKPKLVILTIYKVLPIRLRKTTRLILNKLHIL